MRKTVIAHCFSSFAIVLLLSLLLVACGDEPTAPPTAYLFPTTQPVAPSVAPLYTPGTAVISPRLPAITIIPTLPPTPAPSVTPRPIPPTPTYRPTVAPSVKPLPSPPAFNPSKPDALAKSVTDWLNKQPDALPGKPEQVENARSRTRDLLIGWGALGGDAVVEAADLDGDKQPEIIATAAESWHEPPGLNPDYGFVLILRPTKTAWTSATLVSTVVNPTAKVNFFHPAIVKVADLNGDGKPDIVFTEAACGADTCTNRVYVVNYVDNNWVRLTEEKAPSMPSATITFEPNPADNTSQIALFGGTIASPDAGLQRRRTELYRWDATAKVFKLAETRPESSPYLYHRIADATAALLKKDFNTAANLYYQAATGSNNYKLWASERNAPAAQVQQERQALTALARFRLALVYGMNGERERATATLQEAAAQDDVYKGWAQAFASAYQADTSANAVKSGCTAAAANAQSNPKTLEPLNRFGSANPTFTPADLCPVG